MAERSFALNVTPHVAVVGPHRFEFEPESNGAEFADAYSALREAQRSITDAGENVGAAELKIVSAGMRDFVTRFMLDESKALFASVTLPDRVLVQMLEFVAELYGSGSAGKAADRGGASSES